VRERLVAGRGGRKFTSYYKGKSHLILLKKGRKKSRYVKKRLRSGGGGRKVAKGGHGEEGKDSLFQECYRKGNDDWRSYRSKKAASE